MRIAYVAEFAGHKTDRSSARIRITFHEVDLPIASTFVIVEQGVGTGQRLRWILGWWMGKQWRRKSLEVQTRYGWVAR